jgi:predicted TPR repeat methyltransferase
MDLKTSVHSPLGLPELPDAHTVSSAIAALSSADPRFAAMLAQGVSSADALARLGQQFFQTQRFAEAAALFRLAVASAPANSVFWTNYGTALDCIGSFADAAACLQHSLALSPNQPDTWLLLGLVKKKRGDFVGCEAAYRIALQHAPQSGTAWECLGLLQEERKDYAQAIASLEAAIKLGTTNAPIFANLGKLYYQLGRTPEACEAYNQALTLDAANPHYRQMARKAAFVRDLVRGQSVDDALAAYQRSLAPGEEAGPEQSKPEASEPKENKPQEDNPEEGKKDRLDLLQSAFGQLSGFGHLDAARRVGSRYLQLCPDSTVFAYLMKAIEGAPAIDRSPASYVVDHFDSFADGFDAKLVGVLGYDVPQKICSALLRITPPEHKYIALDAGCGTGLCGPLLRSFASELVGVDLSPKMLEQAAKLGIYDQLLCEELTAFLNRSAGRFDLVVATDVAVYIGDLLPVFAAAAKAIRPGGLFAFSTESSTGTTYRLQPSGRFAHSPEYVRSFASPAFEQQICEETTLRLEAGARVPGHLFVFLKNPA